MARRFRLNDGGDNDMLLALVLTVIFLGLSCINTWISILPIVIYPAPMLAFWLTRWACKRHFRKRNATLASQATGPPKKALLLSRRQSGRFGSLRFSRLYCRQSRHFVPAGNLAWCYANKRADNNRDPRVCASRSGDNERNH